MILEQSKWANVGHIGSALFVDHPVAALLGGVLRAAGKSRVDLDAKSWVASEHMGQRKPRNLLSPELATAEHVRRRLSPDAGLVATGTTARLHQRVGEMK